MSGTRDGALKIFSRSLLDLLRESGDGRMSIEAKVPVDEYFQAQDLQAQGVVDVTYRDSNGTYCTDVALREPDEQQQAMRDERRPPNPTDDYLSFVNMSDDEQKAALDKYRAWLRSRRARKP